MKNPKIKSIKKSNKGKKYEKPLTMYPLKPEDALAAFMKIDPKKFDLLKMKEGGK
jgi:hypothetical protein